MGLFGHMRIHESGIERSLDTPSTSSTPTMSNSTHTPSPSMSSINSSTTDTISEAGTDTANFSCSHYSRTFASRIGLVGHLGIHRTETGEPVLGAPTYTRLIRLNCAHCIRTFTQRIGLLGRTSHTLAWSLTCESIGLTPANQCQEPQSAPVAPASTIHTGHAQPFAASAYWVMRVSMTVECIAVSTCQAHLTHTTFLSPALPSPQSTSVAGTSSITTTTNTAATNLSVSKCRRIYPARIELFGQL
ncbi:hypothetical protein SprV_0301269200 [Sparganum proliferum]